MNTPLTLTEATLGKKALPEALAHLIAEANIAHKKPGHTENVVAFVRAVIDACPNDVRRELNWRDVIEAARWLNLADLKIPSGCVVDTRQRASISAELFIEYKLSNDRVAGLIAAHRARGERSLGAQLLDLADAIMGMGAKPSFRSAGKIDGAKVVEKLGAMKSSIHPALYNTFMGALGDGTADRALKHERDEDSWVR